MADKHKTPHAEFFEKIFSVKANTVDFIKGVFPADIVKHLSLSKIKHENISYVSDELKRFFSDVVYSCPVKGVDVKVTLLFEHKSYPERRIHLQLIRYMLCVWEHNERQKEPLSVVVPILVYHGKKKWKKRSMTEYFGKLPELFKPFIPDFDYLLADFSAYSDEDFEKRMFSQVPLIIAASVMKHIFDDSSFDSHLKRLFKEKKQFFNKTTGHRLLKSLLFYIWEGTKVSEEDISNVLDELSKEAKEVGMTTADKLRKEGELKGELKGKLEGELKGKLKGELETKLETIKNMLKKDCEWKFITDITGITKSKYQKLLKSSK